MNMQNHLNMLSNLTRRDMLRYSAAGIGGMALGSPLQASAVKPGKAKAVIQIWMWGGPTHLDTFDPKPDAGTDYCGPYATPTPHRLKPMSAGSALARSCRYWPSRPINIPLSAA